MDRVHHWLGAVALVLLVGCTAPPSPGAPAAQPDATTAEPTLASPTEPPASPSTPTDARPTADLRMLQYGCTTLFGAYPVSGAEAQAYLPAGFQPAPYAVYLPASFAAVIPGHVVFLTKSWSCRSTTIDGVPHGASNTSVYYLPVLPPPALREANVSAYFVLIGLVTSSAEEAALYESWNLTGARVGQVSIRWDDSEAVSVGNVSAAEGAFGYEQTTAAGRESRSAAFQARYFGVVDGRVTNAVEIPVSASRVRGDAPSHLEFTEGSNPFASPVGPGMGYHQYWDAADLSYGWKSIPIPNQAP